MFLHYLLNCKGWLSARPCAGVGRRDAVAGLVPVPGRVEGEGAKFSCCIGIPDVDSCGGAITC